MICSLFQESNIKPINTFTIGFDEKSHDESKYASEVAEMLKTKHNLKVISNNLDIEKTYQRLKITMNLLQRHHFYQHAK